MSKYVYVVTIASTEWSDISRVFTDKADAETFIETCKKEDPHPRWEYGMHYVELDGDPEGCC